MTSLNRILAATVLLVATPAVRAAAPPRTFRHPGILQSRDDLEFMKQKVTASAQPWKQAWDNLLSQPYSSPDFQPRPIPYIVRGG